MASVAKGFAVLAEELAPAVCEELVELSVGKTPDVFLVLLEAAGRQQAAEQRPCFLVPGGSITTMCSKIGNSWRCASISSLMSSPSGVNGKGGTVRRWR